MNKSSYRAIAAVFGYAMTIALSPLCATAQDCSSVPSAESDTTYARHFREAVDPKLPPFDFYTRGESFPPDSEASEPAPVAGMVAVSILRSDTHDTIQDIEEFPEMYGERPGIPFTVDANFDGYPDVCFLHTRGATGNEYFSFWLYDPLTQQFVLNDDYSRLCCPYFDDSTRQIHTMANGSRSYYCETLIVQNNKPTPIAFLAVVPDTSKETDDAFLCIRGRIVAGKQIDVQTTHVGNEVFALPEFNYGQ